MRLGRNGFILVALIYVLTGLFFFCYRYLEKGANGFWPDWRPDFIHETTGATACLLTFYPLFLFTNRFPLLPGRLWRHVAYHLALLPAWSITNTFIMATLRPPLYQLVLGREYDYGYMPVRFLMEFSVHSFIFWAQVGAISAFRFQKELRLKEIRAAQLERELTQAQLDALKLQLRPHFLFNALNAISSVMYEDARKADRMISSLSEFLRATLRQDSVHKIPLSEELRLLNQYLGIMQVRFGDRMNLSMDVPEHLHDALTPPLLLQPLLENCVQHGVDAETGLLQVEVTAEVTDDRLCFLVRDYGPGMSPNNARPTGTRVGIANTRRRLERLYGENQSLTLENAQGRGTVVTVTLPLERVPEGES
jgi:two-component system LytT family sensor kinase